MSTKAEEKPLSEQSEVEPPVVNMPPIPSEINPCLATPEKHVDCEYITSEPARCCTAPHSVRCTRCLTF